MMQHAKLMSSVGLASAKQDITDALSELETSPSSTQCVYTSLTRIFNALADHPQAQPAVDSTLATLTSVQLLKQLVTIHLREEEVQWVLARLIALACQASIRFQCQAGQLEIWNDLMDVRSAHPHSLRVQEASLRASEALSRSNEFHITKLRPQQLLEDLLGIMDRSLRVQTPRRRAHDLVVLVLRVLVALYSSPRPVGLMLFVGEGPTRGEIWMREISMRMLDSFAVFNRDSNSIRSWLDMALLLLRQYPTQAMESFFSPTSSKEITWWFLAVVENWQPQVDVMAALLATLTYLFALPHKTLGDGNQDALADKLILEQNLLNVMCGVIDHYRDVSSAVEVHDDARSSQREAAGLVLVEAIRVVRQWSEHPKLVPRFEASRSVKGTLLPVLIDQLQMNSKQLPLSPKQLMSVFEILLVLRHLAASRSLRSVLVGSDSLQTSLKWLRCRRSSDGTTRPFTSAADARDDGDFDALVAREARNVSKLIAARMDAANIINSHSGVVVSKAAVVAAPRRHVKPETIRVYCNNYKR